MASVFLFIAALLSKEASIILPFLLMLCIYTLNKKEEKVLQKAVLWKYFPFLCIVIVYLLFRIFFFNLSGKSLMDGNTGLAQRLLTTPYIFVSYIKLLLLPFGLHMERVINPIYSILDLRFLASMAIIAVILVFGSKRFRTSKVVFFGGMWFLTGFIPISNILPLNAPMAEHWLYIPSIGFFILLALVLDKLRHLALTKKFWILPVIVPAALFMVLTIGQNEVWRDSATLYQYNLKFSPNNARLHTNLGNACLKKGLIAKAIEEHKIAISLNSNYATAYMNLGETYQQTNNYNEAIKAYEKALSINPKYLAAHNNLGNAYFKKGWFHKAAIAYTHALELNPHDYVISMNLANAYMKNKNHGKAIEIYNKALKLNPRLFAAHVNLGAIYLMDNKPELAIQQYKAALKVNPKSARTYLNLSYAYSKTGEDKLAQEALDKALKLDPSKMRDMTPIEGR